jgi:hypothetical protein
MNKRSSEEDVKFMWNTDSTLWEHGGFNGSLMGRAAKVIWWLGSFDITVVDTFQVMIIFPLCVWLQNC